MADLISLTIIWRGESILFKKLSIHIIFNSVVYNFIENHTSITGRSDIIF